MPGASWSGPPGSPPATRWCSSTWGTSTATSGSPTSRVSSTKRRSPPRETALGSSQNWTACGEPRVRPSPAETVPGQRLGVGGPIPDLPAGDARNPPRGPGYERWVPYALTPDRDPTAHTVLSLSDEDLMARVAED